jgi:hypothetical protein
LVLSLLVALCCVGCGGGDANACWTIPASGESFEEIWSDALARLGIPEADPVMRDGQYALIVWKADGSLSRLTVLSEYSDSSGESLMQVFTNRLVDSQELSVSANRHKAGRDWPVRTQGVPMSRLFRAVDFFGYEGLLALGGATVGEGEGLMLHQTCDYLNYPLYPDVEDRLWGSPLFVFQDEGIVEFDRDVHGDYSGPVGLLTLWKAKFGVDSVGSIYPALAYLVVRCAED